MACLIFERLRIDLRPEEFGGFLDGGQKVKFVLAGDRHAASRVIPT